MRTGIETNIKSHEDVVPLFVLISYDVILIKCRSKRVRLMI